MTTSAPQTPELTAVSPNYNDRPAGVPTDMLVLHYTGMETGRVALERLCDPDAKVSAHYLIEEDGTVFRLVDEDKRAWHAGVSWWRGSMDVNSRSIGIELVNPGHEFGYRAFPEAQMMALEALASSILKRHPIPAQNVVGHADVAPARKEDPGELFDWRRLAARGIGLWVDNTALPSFRPSMWPCCSPLLATTFRILRLPCGRFSATSAKTGSTVLPMVRRWAS